MQAEGYDGELSPAQWMALRYFARANFLLPNSVGIRGVSSDHRGLSRKLSRHLREVGTWSDSDRKRTGEASVCD